MDPDFVTNIKIILAITLICTGIFGTGFFSLLIYHMKDIKREDQAQAFYFLGVISLLPLIIYLLVLLLHH